MSKLAFSDINSNESFTWEKVFELVQKKKVYHPVCKSESFSEIFIHLIQSLILDREIIMVDETSALELKDNDLLSFDIENSQHNFPKTPQQFIANLEKLSNWKITLFTSGTTGRPKKITHSFQSITRNIKRNAHHQQDVWALAYPLKHMSGIQVFFQALLNLNPIIVVFGSSATAIISALDHYGVTHISATSTFYRLLGHIDPPLSKIKNVSFGGEKVSDALIEKLALNFPSAKFRNIYASTEAGALFATEKEYFKLDPLLKDVVKIVDDEILLHKSILGDLNQDLLENDWYRTGDLVEFKDPEKKLFIFLARKNELINVGGHKVNPTEVEHVLNSHPDIATSRVFAKKNSVTGNIICAEVVKTVSELSEKDIHVFLENKLQEYKIPRIIIFVDQIKTTSTGKIVRVNH